MTGAEQSRRPPRPLLPELAKTLEYIINELSQGVRFITDVHRVYASWRKEDGETHGEIRGRRGVIIIASTYDRNILKTEMVGANDPRSVETLLIGSGF